MKFDRRFAFFAILFGVLYGWLSHWKVFEFDLFFNLRAGYEILQTWHVQKVDTWSFTVRGKPCFNFEWLSTVVDYLVFKWGNGYAILGWLRSILIGIWVFFLMFFIWSASSEGIAIGDEKTEVKSNPKWFPYFLAVLLIPWIYLMCSFRLQMRPDLFAACHYVVFLMLWQSRLSLMSRKYASLLVLLSWANFHAGTVIIGIFTFSCMMVFPALWKSQEILRSIGPGEFRKPTETEKIWKACQPCFEGVPWIAAALSTLFLTPQGVNILNVLEGVLVKYNYSLTGNPDFQPFTWKLFDVHHAGWIFRLWFIYNALAVLGFYIILKKKKTRLPSFYSDPWGVIFIAAVMTWMTFNKIRMIHYQVVFLLPAVSVALTEIWEGRKSTGQKIQTGLNLRRSVFIGAALFLYFALLPDQVRFISRPIGEGIDEVETPVESVEFLKKEKPEKNMLNAYNFGGYLIQELPEYPVALDGRGPYDELIQEINGASQNASSYADLLRRYGINVAVQMLPTTLYDSKRGFMDSHDFLYPRTEWALVFFDQASVVYVRRIPQHEKLINQHEYHFIRRGLPANYAAMMNGIAEPMRVGFRQEFDRCLLEMANNVYCLIGRAAFFEKEGKMDRALELLLRAQAVNSRSPELFLELASVYKALGRMDEAEEAQGRFTRLTE